MNETKPNPVNEQEAAVAIEEPWVTERRESRLENLKGSQGGKNYSHVGGVNTSFEDHLFGACDPHGTFRQRIIMHEKPVHRLMQQMFAKGYTVEEIAQYTHYTRLRVADVLRQPWAQMNIVDNIKSSIQDDIKQLLESEVIPSLQKIINIRDSETTPPAVALAASESIVSRLMGKPNQPITNQTAEPSKMSNQELESEVSKIISEVRSVTPAVESGNGN